MTRLVKQLIFLGIYLVLGVGILWPVYRVVVPAPTCTDGVMNGKEEGVDCGALACGVLCPPPVEMLEVAPAQLIRNSDGSWDLLLLLENPNGAYGATDIPVTVTVTDAAGVELATRRSTTYANPSQPRYLFWTLGKPASEPANAEVALAGDRIRWAQLTFEAAGSVQFGIRGGTLERGDSSVRFSASATNRSKFDFATVDVAVLLKNAAGEVIGAGTTVIRTLLAGQERGFVVDWPFAVPDAVDQVVIVGTDLFSNDNFLREYGSEGRVQGF